ncbi:MAG: hypothetical protein ACRDWA_16865 [Acidimicrobiia bacterium]
MERAARRSAVWALASAVPHPDIFGSADGSPDPAAEVILMPTLRWTVSEVVDLLDLIDDEQGIDRGTFGQHVYQLLIMDPSHVTRVAEAAIQAVRDGAMDIAGWALMLVVYWPGDDGETAFDQLVGEEPKLAQTWSAEQISHALGEFGHVSL